MSSSPARTRITARDARLLLLGGLDLAADPARRVTPGILAKAIERIGFVQVDTISSVARAHEHILLTRFDDFRLPMLARLLERDRKMFEHWTHDASIIPRRWLAHWLPRMERYGARGHSRTEWWAGRFGGKADEVIEGVLERIRVEGPLRSRDFEHERPKGESGTWWGWKPQKAALEFLWRSGRLAIAGRESFQKRYDLIERVFPEVETIDRPTHAENVDWKCRKALDVLGAATSTELAAFFRSITPGDAAAWCRDAIARGEVEPVEIECVGTPTGDAKPRAGVAVTSWKRRVGRTELPAAIRLLSPFDPLVRDRARLERLFGFAYRFEAFVPAAKRQYGYYVLPVLDGEEIVARLDPKFERQDDTLHVRRVWWEAGVKPTPARRRRLEEAIAVFAHGLGATHYDIEEMSTAGV